MAVPAAVALGFHHPEPAAIAYGSTMVAMFLASSTYHSRSLPANWRPAMRRIDHAMIYLYIAGCCAPYSLGGLGGSTLGWGLLTLISAGAILGAVWKLLAFEANAKLAAGLYILLGWLGVFSLPEIFSRLGALELGLICASGILYTAGAAVLALRWPDPAPMVFGYHEVWHTAVVAASGCYFAAVWRMPTLR
jgi:hemolysin III